MTSLLLALALIGPDTDTLRLRVGMPEVQGQMFVLHAGKVVVERDTDQGTEVVTQWTNHLAFGDSASRPVMRWITRGSTRRPDGTTGNYVLRQTMDRETLAPYGYDLESSSGTQIKLRINGRQVEGWRKGPQDTARTMVNLQLSEPPFMAGAWDLIVVAATMKEGLVMVMPVWQPGMADIELRSYTITGTKDVKAGDQNWNAFVVEERKLSDPTLMGTWYLVNDPPYMVYAEVTGPDGRPRRMIETSIPVQ